jgi:integrase/recombinase XerC
VASRKHLPEVHQLLARARISAVPLSDLRQFAAFCEGSWEEEAGGSFGPSGVTTPVITLYRAHLKNAVELKPATINRHLVSIKRYFSWALDEGLVPRDPAKAVRLVPRVVPPPRHLTDREEAALVGAVERYGTLCGTGRSSWWGCTRG